MRVPVVAVMCIVAGAGAMAQVDEDALFGEPLVVDEAPDETQPVAEPTGSDPRFEPSSRVGGSFSFGVNGRTTWSDPESLDDLVDWPDGEMTTDLTARLYIDSRPAESFRVYAEADVTYPFRQGADREFDDILAVSELFSDFDIGDAIFARAGKHTVTWGVGYFFSPADIINIERIDPLDPELDREGPVSARLQYATPESNLYLYALPPVGERERVVLAPRAEAAFGRFEFGIGAYLERMRGFTAMLTGTGSVRRVNLFAEAVLQDNSDRTFVRPAEVTAENPLGLETYADEATVLSATAGASYAVRNTTGRYGIRIIGQYFFNGDGYEDSAVLRDERPGVAALLADGTISAADLVETGRHYAAALVSWSNILDSDVSASASWYGNLMEAAGRATATVSVLPWERVSLQASLAYVYGDPGSEAAPDGNVLEAGWIVSLGNGLF